MAKLTIKEINNPISTYQKRFNKLPDSEFLLLDEDKLYLRVRSNQEPLWVFIFKFNKKQHVMVKYFRKEFKLLSLKNSYAQQVSGNSVLS